MTLGVFEQSRLVTDGRQLSEETIISLKRIERDLLVAQLGLKGTLWGAVASLAVIVLIVLSPMFTKRNLVEGWEVVAIVASMVLSVVFYGAFIFDRSLSMSARSSQEGLDLSAATAAKPAMRGPNPPA